MTRSLQSVTRLLRHDYVCPSCTLRQLSTVAITTTSQRVQRPQRTRTAQHGIPTRRTVSLASSTAINSPSYIPTKYEHIHHSFTKLQDDAAAFADLSRIQLVLKTLESETPTFRVGFLALGPAGGAAARNLARVLLSDALGAEEGWEKELVNGTDERSLLLRYGEPDDLTQSNAVMRVLAVPSRYLQKHKLEILITPLSSDFTSTTREDIEDALLVPSLTIPASSGRVGFVRNPVHKSLIIAGGVGGAVQLGRLPLLGESSLIAAAVDIAAKGEMGAVKVVDTTLASDALQNFRTDSSSGGSFGDKWLASGVPELSEWIASEQAATNVQEYASSTLAAVDRAVSEATASEAENAQSSTVSDDVRGRLQTAITNWSAEAHRDLRNNLSTALDSRAWRRTAWFRLLWRIDDVSYSSIDILNQCWLNETEQSLAFLSGRIREAGLASDDELKENGTAMLSPRVRQAVIAAETPENPDYAPIELTQIPTMLSRVHQQSGIDPLFDPPWPQTINLARQAMLHANVPEMHRKAQALVLSTLSTVGGTSALGAWLWVATSGVALYEAGAIAALGLVWSMRRLQRLWGKERVDFSMTVQENGRKVLVEIETQLRRLVRYGGRPPPAEADAQVLERARHAVEKCREALVTLKKP